MAYRDDLDPDTTNRLLSGRLDPDDAPPRHREVAVLLQAAHTEARTSAVLDDALIAAMVDAIVAPDLARSRRKHVLTRIVMTKAAAVAVVALSATGAAAATGRLPDAAQDGFAHAAQHIGINLPSSANDKAHEQTQRDDPNDEHATKSSLPTACRRRRPPTRTRTVRTPPRRTDRRPTRPAATKRLRPLTRLTGPWSPKSRRMPIPRVARVTRSRPSRATTTESLPARSTNRSTPPPAHLRSPAATRTATSPDAALPHLGFIGDPRAGRVRTRPVDAREMKALVRRHIEDGLQPRRLDRVRDDARRRLHRALRRRRQGQRRARPLRDGVQDAAAGRSPTSPSRSRTSWSRATRSSTATSSGARSPGATFLGIEPAGQRYEKPGTTIYRVADGRLAESWGVEDTLGWFRQLGKYVD